MTYELIIENIYSGERQNFNFHTKNKTNFDVFCKAMSNLTAFGSDLTEWILVSFKKSKINKNE